jgi:hypothetical protein
MRQVPQALPEGQVVGVVGHDQQVDARRPARRQPPLDLRDQRGRQAAAAIIA